MSLLQQRHEEYHNYDYPNETNFAKIWTNHRLHEYVAKRAFGIDVEGLSKKIASPLTEEDKTETSIPASQLEESHLEAKNFGSVPFSELRKSLSNARKLAREVNTEAENAYIQLSTELVEFESHCEGPQSRYGMPMEFKILSKPLGTTLAEIISGGEDQTTDSPFRGLLKVSLAVVGVKAEYKMMTNEEKDTHSADVFSSEPTDGHKFVLQLLPWTAEATRAEADVENAIGSALREFFTDDAWIMTSNTDWLSPPAIGLGSVIPKPDYVASIKDLNIPIIIFGRSYDSETSFAFSSNPESEYNVQGNSQIAITALPILFLLVLASTTLCEDKLIVKPSKDDYILAINYDDDCIEIDALVPIWRGTQEGWQFTRSTIKTFLIRLERCDINDWTSASWRRLVHIADVLKAVKEHNRKAQSKSI